MPHLFVRYYKDGLVGCCTADVGYEQIDAYLSDRHDIDCDYYVVEPRKYKNLMGFIRRSDYNLHEQELLSYGKKYNSEGYRPPKPKYHISR